jgi:hypothetical protein
MTIVYVVFLRIEYSVNDVEGIYTTEELALKRVDMLITDKVPGVKIEIEEWALDEM